MRRIMLALTVSGLMALGACGSDDSSAGSSAGNGGGSSTAEASDAVKDAKDCTELLDAAQPVFRDLIQSAVDQAATMSAEDLANPSADAGPLKELGDRLERDGAAIEARADELGCTEDDAKAALCQVIDTIDTKGNQTAEMIVNSMAGECA